MAKVHPSCRSSAEREEDPTVLTVWRKSLLFNGSGFTVFDGNGDLFFRVDNYCSKKKAEIVLMDRCGSPILSIRRKRLSLIDRWRVYQGEETASPIFTAKKVLGVLGSKILAKMEHDEGSFIVEGSFHKRSCAIYDFRHRRVAEIAVKESVGGVRFGGDVFRLVVMPGFDAAVAMAVVILLDQMFQR
ncbi:protein LURP-one-related 8-like [Wolffia australiana]